MGERIGVSDAEWSSSGSRPIPGDRDDPGDERCGDDARRIVVAATTSPGAGSRLGSAVDSTRSPRQRAGRTTWRGGRVVKGSRL